MNVHGAYAILSHSLSQVVLAHGGLLIQMESNSITPQLCSQMVLLKIKEPDTKLLPM